MITLHTPHTTHHTGCFFNSSSVYRSSFRWYHTSMGVFEGTYVLLNVNQRWVLFFHYFYCLLFSCFTILRSSSPLLSSSLLFTSSLLSYQVIKNSKDFFDQSLDEIKLLQYINAHGDADEHNVLKLIDFFYCKEHLFIVSELLR